MPEVSSVSVLPYTIIPARNTFLPLPTTYNTTWEYQALLSSPLYSLKYILSKLVNRVTVIRVFTPNISALQYTAWDSDIAEPVL